MTESGQFTYDDEERAHRRGQCLKKLFRRIAKLPSKVAVTYLFTVIADITTGCYKVRYTLRYSLRYRVRYRGDADALEKTAG